MTNLEIELRPLLPALVPLVGIGIVLIADLVTPRLRRVPYAVAALAAAGGAAASVAGLAQAPGDALRTFCAGPTVAGDGSVTGSLTGDATGTVLPPPAAGAGTTCFWQADALGSALQLAACFAALVCILLAWPRTSRRVPGDGAREPIEAILLLTALAGTVVVAASRDAGTWLVALELATLPVIALVALSGGRRAVAGAVQLLVTSLVSFALLVLGVALWFAATGSPLFDADAALRGEGFTYVAPGAAVMAWPDVSEATLALAVLLIVAGLAFKLSLVPFHAWTPTAYTGSSLPVATFLATVSKIAALAALLVVLRGVALVGSTALVAIAVLAAVSMTLGNLMALRQDDVVRLLAWSTVAQAGWVVMPLVSVSPLGIGASATYLLTYVVATAVAFAVVALTVRERPGTGRTLDAYTGLWHRHRWRAGALALALLSLAGLPPGIIGLVGKVVALRPVVAEGWVWLTVIAAANAVLGVAVYLRWLRPVVTATAESEAPHASTRGPGNRPAIVLGLVLATVVLVVVSVQPDALLRLLG